MDDKLFKQRLSEVAEWKIPDTPRETSLNAKKKRGRKSNEELYMEVREEMFHEEFGGVNETYPPMLVKLRSAACVCDDCGNTCPNGRQKEKKLYKTGKNEKRNWRERCLTCDKSKNPFTGKFDLTPQQASHVWTQFLRDSKGVYKTQGNEARQLIEIKASDPNSIDDDTGVITYYPDSTSTK